MDEQHDNETVVFYGDAVKALGDGRVGGYLVRYGNPDTRDLEGDYFAPDTDFGGADSSAVYYNHGLDPRLGRKRLGTGDLKTDEVGVWVETQLQLADEYQAAIYELVEAGKLGWSSGTAAHLVERDDSSKIVHWPLGLDASITPTPAEPRNVALPLKSFAEKAVNLEGLLEGQGADAQPTEDDDSATLTVKGGKITVTVEKESTMSDEVKVPEEEQAPVENLEVKEIIHDEPINADGLKTLSGQVGDLTEQVAQLLAYAQDEPAIKNAGYISQDGYKADPHLKSFGDFLMAVQRKDEVRLKSVYETKAAMAEGSGVTGGYLVPAQFLNQLLQDAMDAAHVRPRATVIPVASNRGSVPALDQATAPTAGVGQSAWAGGARARPTAEAAALTETEPAFKEIEFNIYKMGGFSYVSNELLADSAQSVEAILSMVFGRAIAAVEDYAFLRGTGAGMPRGILNGPASIAIAPDTNNAFAGPDALEMVSRFRPWGGESHWIMHREMIPDLADSSFDGAGGDMSVLPKTANVFGRPIYGYPIYLNEHLPQSDNSGCVILADLRAYGIFDREGLAIAFSPDFRFTNDQGTWRFTKRLDGDQLLTEAITLGDPQSGYSVSPFVYLND